MDRIDGLAQESFLRNGDAEQACRQSRDLEPPLAIGDHHAVVQRLERGQVHLRLRDGLTVGGDDAPAYHRGSIARL